MPTTHPSRRRFLHGTAALGLSALGYSRVCGANDRLRLAAVGVGGKGWDDLRQIAASPAVDVAAVCDTDQSDLFGGQAVKGFPRAAVFADWRRLFDKPGQFDAVSVSTPDHSHAPVVLRALGLKKPVFCQKPLTHTVHEARQLRLAAAKAGVATQMGNQIQSTGEYRTAVRLVHDGVIGKVKEVHAWIGGKPSWRKAADRPPGADPVPAGVDWDVWLGPAPVRPYKVKLYHDFNWRNWQDFSNGQLGDFGCHILDPVFLALGLTAPTAVQADGPKLNREAWGTSAVVRYEFPGTVHTAGKTLPLTWYDGDDARPPLDRLGLGDGAKLPNAGSVLVGEAGSLVIPHVALPQLYPTAKYRDFKLELVPRGNHYTGWADAARGVGTTTSHFGYAGPLTEAVLLGTVALRLPGEKLVWDERTLKVTTSAVADALLRKEYRKGWEPEWVTG